MEENTGEVMKFELQNSKDRDTDQAAESRSQQGRVLEIRKTKWRERKEGSNSAVNSKISLKRKRGKRERFVHRVEKVRKSAFRKPRSHLVQTHK